MQSKESLGKCLQRGLRSELKAIQFYTDNLQKLNYAKNESELRLLILDSVSHAQALTEQLLDLLKGAPGTLDPDAVREAHLEELSMKEIYKFELEQNPDESVKKLMFRLIKEEEKHDKMVDALK